MDKMVTFRLMLGMAWAGAQWSPKFINKMHRRANKMRKRQTPIERKMERILKSLGVNFVCQSVIGKYIADFELTDHKIIIETDGYAYHSTAQQKDRDDNRDTELEKMGYCVYRVPGWNLSHPEWVKEQLKELIASWNPQQILMAR